MTYPLRRHRFDEAMGVYEELQQRGLQPDSYTLTALVTACERVGNWRQALDVFNDFSTRRIPIVTRNYNSLIFTLATGGQWQKVRASVFARSKQSSHSVTQAAVNE